MSITWYRSAIVASLLMIVARDACAAAMQCERVANVNSEFRCTLAGWPDRPVDISLPVSGYDGIVIVLHGGNGNSQSMRRLTCPRGDLGSPRCFHRRARQANFISVFPNGTRNQLGQDRRTWNAGGGIGDYACVAGNACLLAVDEQQYFSDLLDALQVRFPGASQNVFATGMSNGAAMAFKLACDIPSRIDGIAPVAGGDQAGLSRLCANGSPLPVLHIHGTADTSWPYVGGYNRTIGGRLVSMPRTLAGWIVKNGCQSTPQQSWLPDINPSDGTRVRRDVYVGCSPGMNIVHYLVRNGGHSWPQGRESASGEGERMSQDVSANQVIIDFFTGLVS